MESGSPKLLESPRLRLKFPQLPRKFPNDFYGSSLTVELNSNPEVPGSFPDFPKSSPDFPRSCPDFPGSKPLFSGKPETKKGDGNHFEINSIATSVMQAGCKGWASLCQKALHTGHSFQNNLCDVTDV